MGIASYLLEHRADPNVKAHSKDAPSALFYWNEYKYTGKSADDGVMSIPPVVQ